MASLTNTLLISMLFGASAVAVVSKDKATASVVRRELAEVSLDSRGNQIRALKETFKMHHDGDEDTACNKQFIQKDETVDSCAGTADEELINPAREILDPAMCESASSEFGTAIEMAPRDEFELDTHQRAFLPFPKGCFLNTQPKATSNLTLNKVYFNPTASNVSAGTTLVGKKICSRRKYVNGTADTAGDAACTGGTVPITTYNGCWAAAQCKDGGDAPKLEDFKNNATTKMTYAGRPGGCFTTVIGKWGFNSNTAPAGVPEGKWNGTTICMSPGGPPGATTATAAPSSS